MSKICIGVLCNDHTANLDIKQQLKEKVCEYNWNVFFELSYDEPFLKELDCSNALVFSISDRGDFDNCEMLLLPDGCLFNGLENAVLFKTRIHQVRELLKSVLIENSKLELFIGESGTALDEFDSYCINLNEFGIVTEKLNTICQPDLHLTILA